MFFIFLVSEVITLSNKLRFADLSEIIRLTKVIIFSESALLFHDIVTYVDTQ